ncbi:hypothetical protein Hypma_003334 [Hypsizygus marmoreus]|uniref:Uncharacterized protein n=1 Tax=Hypsizygus marmoreus TaxID=39966 RepID=A0A369J2E5_HYPMA|nr:hypothetical protein Hypma_003334 [Hypsizygus marmoreus]
MTNERNLEEMTLGRNILFLPPALDFACRTPILPNAIGRDWYQRAGRFTHFNIGILASSMPVPKHYHRRLFHPIFGATTLTYST